MGQEREVTCESQSWGQSGEEGGRPCPAAPSAGWSAEIALCSCLGVREPQPVLGAGAGELTLCHRDEERANPRARQAAHPHGDSGPWLAAAGGGW